MTHATTTPCPAPEAGRRRLLVVEDEEMIATLLVRYLAGQRGCQVAVAQDGAAAIDQAARETYDAVLMDLMMPRTNGVEAIRTLKAAWPAMPIIVMSGANEAMIQEALRAGAEGALRKPFRMRELTALLDQMLRPA
jgi:two-component system response regulator MprA